MRCFFFFFSFDYWNANITRSYNDKRVPHVSVNTDVPCKSLSSVRQTDLIGVPEFSFYKKEKRENFFENPRLSVHLWWRWDLFGYFSSHLSFTAIEGLSSISTDFSVVPIDLFWMCSDNLKKKKRRCRTTVIRYM